VNVAPGNLGATFLFAVGPQAKIMEYPEITINLTLFNAIIARGFRN